jgi:hypothetical protein
MNPNYGYGYPNDPYGNQQYYVPFQIFRMMVAIITITMPMENQSIIKDLHITIMGKGITLMEILIQG